MGDIADMMLEGQMCQWCGEILDGDGYPVVCAGCQRRHNVDMHGDPLVKLTSKEKFECPICKKRYAGLSDHMRDKHRK